MEVSAVPQNPNYPEGGDYGNRAPNPNYIGSANDPRGDYFSSNPRGQNSDYAQRPYQPQERVYVASHGACSHCQTHCCPRPTEYQNQPTGSRGERLERYGGNVRNDPHPAIQEPVQEVRSRTHVQGVSQYPETSAEVPLVNEQVATESSVPPPSKDAECSIPYNPPVEEAHPHNAPNHPEMNYNDPSHYRPETVAPPSASSHIESPFISEERRNEPHASTVPLPRASEPNVARSVQPTTAQLPSTAQSLPLIAPRINDQDSVASLMIPPKLSSHLNPANQRENPKFNPASLTHLNFKEKQLAMSAVKKAAANMSCVRMFQDKDRENRGKIGRRDFQIVMDRIGVLRGLSSREIDAVFKGFSTQTDTEIDYKRFSEACKHAIDNDYRLARMAYK